MPGILWFRRDFRLTDHAALHHAARQHADGILPVFVLDDAILRHADTGPAIVEFMLGCLAELGSSIQQLGGQLLFLHGDPVQQLPRLARAVGATALHFNRDYAPNAVERDVAVVDAFSAMGLQAHSYKDQVIYEEQDILAASTGEPYTVFTPYKKAWLARLGADGLPASLDPATPRFLRCEPRRADGLKPVAPPTAASLGFNSGKRFDDKPGQAAAGHALKRFVAERLGHYKRDRDFPALAGTSRLSPHLRHGTISIRQCLRAAHDARKTVGPASAEGIDCWISELIWREFYQQILFNFPHVASGPFKRELADLQWQTHPQHWQAWCVGRTGVPIVDAAMRQLNATGWMHNRLRMIVAMYLTKDLLLDYRLGERYFMQHLIDGETAQNNGGWQWSASTGTDAAPYFRIFNPVSQGRKFDPSGAFVRQWCPELAAVPDEHIHSPWELSPLAQQMARCVIGRDYPAPIVDHAVQRDMAIAMFRK